MGIALRQNGSVVDEHRLVSATSRTLRTAKPSAAFPKSLSSDYFEFVKKKRCGYVTRKTLIGVILSLPMCSQNDICPFHDASSGVKDVAIVSWGRGCL